MDLIQHKEQISKRMQGLQGRLTQSEASLEMWVGKREAAKSNVVQLRNAVAELQGALGELQQFEAALQESDVSVPLEPVTTEDGIRDIQ